MLEKNCLQRCIDKKKKFAERDFSSPPSRKIMVRPLALMLLLLAISLFANVELLLPEFFCEGTMQPLSVF